MTDTFLFFDRTYDEAMTLLVEARDYMQMSAPIDRADMSPLASLRVTAESLRLTTRLTEVMAWCLTQKAVRAGEIEERQAADPRRRLGALEICLADNEADDVELPAGLACLLQRSLSLY